MAITDPLLLAEEEGAYTPPHPVHIFTYPGNRFTATGQANCGYQQ
jgi:hypothetical protein